MTLILGIIIGLFVASFMLFIFKKFNESKNDYSDYLKVAVVGIVILFTTIIYCIIYP